MQKRVLQRRPISLKWGLMAVMVACWVIPIVTIIVVAGVLLNRNYEQSLRESVSNSVDHAMEQTTLRLSDAMESSKAVSYNGDIRDAYRAYQSSGNRQTLYNRVTSYFGQNFSRNETFKAAFLTFNDHPDKLYYYADSYRANGYQRAQYFRTEMQPRVDALLQTVDSGIYFLEDEGDLYITRNLLDVTFHPYAQLTLLCDVNIVFQSFSGLAENARVDITLDDVTFRLSEGPQEGDADMQEVLPDYAVDFGGGHTLTVAVAATALRLWGAMPGLRWAVVLILLLGIPMAAGIVLLFRRLVTRPVETLVDAAARVASGQRGYLIQDTTGSLEFQKLYGHFNEMSTELQRQFQQLYQEQQALQEARIKALQSQINPHFLNNTLEVISWEARLAENDRVCAMTEALATMLDAALDRDGQGMASVAQELGYVDAYLYIISQRLGPGLTVTKEVDETLLSETIPRLILQPIVENAVEHDLTPQRGGHLLLRVRRQGDSLLLEVVHDGVIAPEDQRQLDALLSGTTDAGGSKVGLRNVRERLHLLYGRRASLTIRQETAGSVLARITLPMTGV